MLLLNALQYLVNVKSSFFFCRRADIGTLTATHEFYGLEPCQHGTKQVDKMLPGCEPRPGKDCVQRYVEWKCNLGPDDDCMRPRKATVCKREGNDLTL